MRNKFYLFLATLVLLYGVAVLYQTVLSGNAVTQPFGLDVTLSTYNGAGPFDIDMESNQVKDLATGTAPFDAVHRSGPRLQTGCRPI